MKLSQIISYAVVLGIGGGIGYLIGSSSNKVADNPQNIVVATPSQTVVPESAPIAETTTATEPETVLTSPTTTPTPTPVPAKVPVPATVPSKPATTAVASLPNADLCFTGDQLGVLLTQYAEEMEALKLWYNPALMQDCSGIFYRLINDFAKKRCPDYPYPNPKEARPARMIAQWYHTHKNFSFVEDPMEKRNLIKPGAVMFYGRPGQSYKNMTVERMCGGSGTIFHIGVVTAVEKDEQGNVIKYTLYHGRSTGTFASRTYYHSVDGPSKRGQPALGVGSQQWVAIAYLFTPPV